MGEPPKYFDARQVRQLENLPSRESNKRGRRLNFTPVTVETQITAYAPQIAFRRRDH